LTGEVISELVAFLALSAVVICTPGPDTALTIRNAVTGGRTGGAWTAAGVATGQLVWTIAASLGAASLLRASQPAFLALKIVGVAYLLYLGVQSLRAAWRGHEPAGDTPTPTRPDRWRAYRQGLINDLANPKMAAFFVSLLPQFVPADSGHAAALAAFLLLGLLFCLLTFGWLLAYSILIARGRRLLDRPAVRRTVDTVAGCTLIGLGVRLALADQTR
jgi:threonine/homoserine/homoserine lactone efflux protein